MARAKIESLGIGTSTGAGGANVPQKEGGLPASILKRYNPTCKTCCSHYFDKIHEWIAEGKTPHWISSRLAEYGEAVSPASIKNHRDHHLKDMEDVRKNYVQKQVIDPLVEISAQVHSTKLELETTRDLDHRRFLMRRIDSLLKALIQLRAAEQKHVPATMIDARKQSITVHGGPRKATQEDMQELADMQAQMIAIQQALDEGKLEIVGDDEGEEAPGGAVLFDVPE